MKEFLKKYKFVVLFIGLVLFVLYLFLTRQERLFYYNDEINKVDFKTFSESNNDGGYVKIDGKIYFYDDDELLELENVDVETFKILDLNYSKDKNNVYSYNSKLEGIDPNKFKILGWGSYTKDDKNVYFGGEKISNADVNSFEFLGKNFLIYSKDKNNVFNGKDLIEEADPETFEILKNLDCNYYYTKDKNHVYEYGKIIEGADPKTFSVDEFKICGYAEDKNNCYAKGNGSIVDKSECENNKKGFILDSLEEWIFYVIVYSSGLLEFFGLK